MSVLKIQRVRFCRTCHESLPQKCSKCLLHPDRKPTTLVYYSWPPIVEICPCKGGIKVRCQRPGCENITPWRWRANAREKMSRSANVYCSKQCNLMVIAAERRSTRATYPCAHCGKSKEIKLSEAKSRAFVFCHRECYRLWQIGKNSREMADLRKLKEGLDGRSLLQCRGKCTKGRGIGDITEHQDITKYKAKCLTCGVERHTGLQTTDYQTMGAPPKRTVEALVSQ